MSLSASYLALALVLAARPERFEQEAASITIRLGSALLLM